jgi:hypothetical protein
LDVEVTTDPTPNDLAVPSQGIQACNRHAVPGFPEVSEELRLAVLAGTPPASRPQKHGLMPEGTMHNHRVVGGEPRDVLTFPVRINPSNRPIAVLLPAPLGPSRASSSPR